MQKLQLNRPAVRRVTIESRKETDRDDTSMGEVLESKLDTSNRHVNQDLVDLLPKATYGKSIVKGEFLT